MISPRESSTSNLENEDKLIDLYSSTPSDKELKEKLEKRLKKKELKKKEFSIDSKDSNKSSLFININNFNKK